MRSLTWRIVSPEKICGNDLEIVVGGVGEGAVAVAISHRPYARHVGPQLIIYLDIAAFVAHDAGVLQAKIVGVRASPSRNQNVGSTNRVTASRAIGPNFHFVTNARYSDAIGIESDVNLLVFKDVTDTLGNVRVFTAQQSRRALNNRLPHCRIVCTSARIQGRCSCRR